jgi:hypothetical protein
MSRLRWAVAVLTGGLGLISGCSTLRDHPWFSRPRTVAAPGCCDAPAAPLAEGPVLEGGPPFVPPPGALPPGGLPPGAELQTPGTNGTLRPVPQPQAQPVPAPPTSRRTPGLIIDRWKDQ